MWRLVFYALVGGLALNAAWSPYVVRTSPGMILGSAMFPLAIYVPIFLWWLFRLWPESPFDHLKPRWRTVSIEIADRTCLYVCTMLFFGLIAVSKGTISPFWADSSLAALDRTIFGTDPWRLTHAVLGPVTGIVDKVYMAWSFVMLFGALAIVTMANEERLARFVLTTALAWIVLGVIVAHALASAGPIFGPELGFGFEDLRREIDPSAHYATMAREYLWKAYSTGSVKVGVGISAMPSMHCALAFVLVFTAWRSRWFIPACVFAASIWIGSVHLGWHYFTDGLVSLIGVSLLWPLAGYIARWRTQPLLGSPAANLA